MLGGIDPSKHLVIQKGPREKQVPPRETPKILKCCQCAQDTINLLIQSFGSNPKHNSEYLNRL